VYHSTLGVRVIKKKKKKTGAEREGEHLIFVRGEFSIVRRVQLCTPHPFVKRDWYFITEQPAPEPHLAHAFVKTVQRFM